jgi:hypothetical protein
MMMREDDSTNIYEACFQRDAALRSLQFIPACLQQFLPKPLLCQLNQPFHGTSFPVLDLSCSLLAFLSPRPHDLLPADLPLALLPLHFLELLLVAFYAVVFASHQFGIIDLDQTFTSFGFCKGPVGTCLLPPLFHLSLFGASHSLRRKLVKLFFLGRAIGPALTTQVRTSFISIFAFLLYSRSAIEKYTYIRLRNYLV